MYTVTPQRFGAWISFSVKKDKRKIFGTSPVGALGKQATEIEAALRAFCDYRNAQPEEAAKTEPLFTETNKS